MKIILAINYKAFCDDLWYKWQKMGIMKRMACSAGVTGGKNKPFGMKNQHLPTKNIPETQIIQLTGHKNLQSLAIFL